MLKARVKPKNVLTHAFSLIYCFKGPIMLAARFPRPVGGYPVIRPALGPSYYGKNFTASSLAQIIAPCS